MFLGVGVQQGGVFSGGKGAKGGIFVFMGVGMHNKGMRGVWG